MSAKDKWVRRFSVDETSKHKNGFTIYKITSVLFPIESPETITTVSVWKRYSDIQSLHKSMKALHAGLHLRGSFPSLPRYSYFKRFQKEVIEERAKTIKSVLEFIAEHRLLFTSTDFVNFLQTGYPEPSDQSSGLINAIRSSLHLPIEDSPPLEYQTDDDSRSPGESAHSTQQDASQDETDFISQIPIYEPFDVEMRKSPENKMSNSLESLNSLESIDSDLYEELNKVTIDKTVSSVRRSVLPDLIIFDAPSASRYDDYHTTRVRNDSDSVSMSSQTEPHRSTSSLSTDTNATDNKTNIVDDYVLTANKKLTQASRCEMSGQYAEAFEEYRAGIGMLLRGVKNDPDPQRRALTKERINKYLSYAEQLYQNHLKEVDVSLPQSAHTGSLSLPASMLKRSQSELSSYRVLGVLGASVMLVLHRREQTCYAMKVIRKIPNNLTEFDEYFLQRTNETKQPILPTSIPYMVTLHAYIETNHLIFLILTYAPGEKLFDYIEKYSKSVPSTPLREVKDVSLDKKIDVNHPDDNLNTESDEIKEMVMNSKELLLNVDKALNFKTDTASEGTEAMVDEINKNQCGVSKSVMSLQYRDVMPSSAICKWSAELVIALESLHNSGVVCVDLNPSNILLGDKGQIILTYFVHYREDVFLTKLPKNGEVNLYVAPELYSCYGDRTVEPTVDWWSLGAAMYRLLCATELSEYHRSVFTSHTILHLPDGLSLEEESILTQLLTYDPSERLGSGPDGVDEIKQHPYFKNINWQSVYEAWTNPG